MAEMALAISVTQQNPLKTFNNLSFPQKGSFQHKSTVSLKSLASAVTTVNF
jgi:hypothetical protein